MLLRSDGKRKYVDQCTLMGMRKKVCPTKEKKDSRQELPPWALVRQMKIKKSHLDPFQQTTSFLALYISAPTPPPTIHLRRSSVNLERPRTTK